MKRWFSILLGGLAAAVAIRALGPKTTTDPAAFPGASDLAAPATGAAPSTPASRADGAKAFGKELLAEVKDDNTTLIAAGLAYYAMLALFPAMIAAVSIYALVLDPATLRDDLQPVADALPDSAYELVETQLDELTASSRGGLGIGVALSILATLWTASGGTKSLIKGLNVAYDVEDDRPFLVQRGLAYGLTVGLIIFGVAAAATVTFLPAVLGEVGLEDESRRLIEWLRWPAILLIVLLGLGLLYKVAPNRPARRSRWLSPGAAVATGLWVVATVGFSIYASNLGNFNATYGALGGVVVLLLWFFISGFIVLLGAQVNAVLEHRAARRFPAGTPARGTS